MYADIVVLTYQPPNTPFYTYKIPKKLETKVKIGQIVSVPFGKRSPQGIVLSTASQSNTTINSIKPIDSVFLTKPILLRYQIDLLKWMSTYYHAPMVNCLEAMIPKLPRGVARAEGVPSSTRGLPTGLDREQYILKTRTPDGTSSRQDLPGQTLILVPNINRLPQTIAKYPRAKNHAIYHNELKIAEKFNSWQKIASGNVDYIFGTRSAIFYALS